MLISEICSTLKFIRIKIKLLLQIILQMTYLILQKIELIGPVNSTNYYRRPQKGVIRQSRKSYRTSGNKDCHRAWISPVHRQWSLHHPLWQLTVRLLTQTDTFLFPLSRWNIFRNNKRQKWGMPIKKDKTCFIILKR